MFKLGSTDTDGTRDKQDNDKLDKALLTALLEEIRDLREQLARSIDANIALKEKLERELGRPVSISPLIGDGVNGTTSTIGAGATPYNKDPTMSAKRSLFSAVLHSVSITEAEGPRRDITNDNGSAPSGKNKKNKDSRASVHFSPFETPTRDCGMIRFFCVVIKLSVCFMDSF